MRDRTACVASVTTVDGVQKAACGKGDGKAACGKAPVGRVTAENPQEAGRYRSGEEGASS